jgi:hypothetical protein
LSLVTAALRLQQLTVEAERKLIVASEKVSYEVIMKPAMGDIPRDNLERSVIPLALEGLLLECSVDLI